MGKKLVKPLAASAKSAKTAKAIAAARPIDALFSRGRQRVLTVLFGNPQRSFYANEIISLAQVGTGATQRELASLADAGLLVVSRQGNQKHFQANPDAAIAGEIYALVRKTMSVAGVVGAALAGLAGQIESAFAYGSADDLRDTATGELALLVVSRQLSDDDLAQALAQAATALDRRIAITVCTPDDYDRQKKQDGNFPGGKTGITQLWLLGSDQQAG